MPEFVQTLIRREGDRYFAECFDYPFQAEADSIDAAIAGIESAARKHFERKDEQQEDASGSPDFYLAVALYFGPFHFA